MKYIELGEFPDARRHFAVLRCNHCTDAPCVEVCPVTALYKREDGIVDFDPERCIGCKACLNACPYDALYIDPNSNTAAKCNFCAHRVELDLKPSCEVVCPVGAIISGDIDDPESEVSRLLGTAPSAVRGAEQGTGPNVYYLGADAATLDPLAAGGGEAYLTTEVQPAQREKLHLLGGDTPAIATMDVDHPPPWGWRVSSYFLSKGVAAGAMMLAPLLLVLGARGSALADIGAGAAGAGCNRDHRRLSGLGSQAAAARLSTVHGTAVAFMDDARHARDQRRGGARLGVHARRRVRLARGA